MNTYIDSHVHVYDATRNVLSDTAAIPQSEASSASLRRDMIGAGVAGAVLVQPSVYGRDHSLLSGVLATGSQLAGVGLIDASALEPPAVPAEVERLYALGLAGIRIHLTAEMMPIALAAASSARTLGLVLDVHVQEPSWPLLWEIADRPDAPRIVVDHFGRPEDPSSASAVDFLAALRDREHMFLKVSGLEVISEQGFPYLDMEPLFQEALEVIGSDRLMWASNFPYCRGSDYAQLLKLCEEFLPPDQKARADVMGGTASQLFALPPAVI